MGKVYPLHKESQWNCSWEGAEKVGAGEGERDMKSICEYEMKAIPLSKGI